MVKWVCGKEGHRDPKWYALHGRKRKPRPESREGCLAMIRVNFDPCTRKWIVKDFYSSHKHDLVPSKHIQFLHSHRDVKEGDKIFFESLHSVGVSTRHIVELCKEQHGGFQKMGYTPKDVENAIQALRKNVILGGDANTTLGYLAGRREADPGFVYNYTVSENKQLGNLFWSDAISRSDYGYFGDVLAFDACYKLHKYNNPLVMLIGVNHHHQSVIFGGAFLENERNESYIWLLQTFLQCMGGKKPVSVITDGDKAMRHAIGEVFPEAAHRLCSWHIDRNAGAQKLSPEFMSGLNGFMKNRISIEEFEQKWQILVKKTGLDTHSWVKNLYEDRHLWCEAYLKENFFGGMTTTSRCEGMNSTIKREELRYETSYLLLEPTTIDGDIEIFKLHRWPKSSRIRIVEYNTKSNSIKCSCFLLESLGIPCRHILNVVKLRKMSAIPSACFSDRWLKKAKVKGSADVTATSLGNKLIETMRYGSLISQCYKLCEFAKKNGECFENTMSSIARAITAALTYDDCNRQAKRKFGDIKDPDVVRTKGTAADTGNKRMRKRKCGICREEGHTRATCPSIKSLNLDSCKIGDEGLANLSGEGGQNVYASDIYFGFQPGELSPPKD
ncbi:Protein FAR1-RELATED SEQUENCE 5 [Linum perenne]